MSSMPGLERVAISPPALQTKEKKYYEFYFYKTAAHPC